MMRGFRIGRLFGTDIYCAPGFFLLVVACFLLAGPGPGALFSVAVIISILVHEFGHVFAVKWLLRAPSTVLLWALGGLCIHQAKASPGKQVGISLMGPAFGFCLAAVSLAAALLLPDVSPALTAFLQLMVRINVIWTAANLLPILPLDGGQALRAALQTALGAGRATRIARWISIVVAGLALAAALYVGERFLALLAALLLYQNLMRPHVAYD
ncbi:MAG: site-2 protease family protein [Planctomycetota bacterium]|jgi:Zn-dependent protease